MRACGDTSPPLSRRLATPVGASAELHCRLLAVRWAVEDRGGPLTPAELVELDELRSAAAGRGMSGSVRRIDEMPELPAKN